MIKGNEIIGRSIVARSNGEKIDTVTDLILDYDGNQVVALLTDEGGWFSEANALRFGDIKTIGEDTVIIDSPEMITTVNPDGKLKSLLDNKIELNGKMILTENGRDLGKITDVYFDEISGRIVGYEATGGMFADMTLGRAYVPRPDYTQIGEDTVLVPPETEIGRSAQESGGLKGAWTSATHTVKDVYESAKEATQEKLAALETATSEQQKKFIVGKTASSEVSTESGYLIVNEGETITQKHAERAEEAGKLLSLLISAAGSSISDTYGSAKETTQALIDELKQASVDKQKQFVVGKQAATEVTAENGEIVVHKDETITQPIADHAEQSGKLGALIASAASGLIAARSQSIHQGDLGTEAAIGRHLHQTVRDEGGYIIGTQGQIVTPKIAEDAEKKGKSEDLLASTGLLHDNNGDDHSGSVLEGARAALAKGMSSATEEASDMLDNVKEWVGEQSDNVKRRIREERIKRALGRPTTRVVLAPDDTIILNVGELITYKAIEMARKAGVLDILVSSADTSDASIDSMDSRPNEAGQASLFRDPKE
ncbi:MAG: PRC-barrel domain-containing protein [Gammaproteobacteria bacterium]|nr:PRC-barrel domain-containing protein [Gammaproteobacteria bacterium]